MILRRSAGAVFIAAALICAAGPLPVSAGRQAPVAPAKRTVRLFIPDTSGNVRLNIVFHKSLGDRELRLLSRQSGKTRFTLKHVPFASMEVPLAALESTLKDLESDPEVVTVEPDPEDQRALGQEVPWGVARIGAEPVWAAGNMGTGIKVAVLDSGIDYTHPDLQANYKGGYDFVNGDKYPLDDYGHGTHVAGTIAAVNNSIGVIGVAPQVDLYALKVLNASGYGSHSNFAKAIDWCIAKGIRIVNYSVGGPTGSVTLQTACQKAYDAGITVVAGAGNEGGGAVNYPAAYNTVLAVGAVDSSNNLADFSNFGPDLDFVAPGVDILSTIQGGGYAAWQGTSVAAPHVTGAAALLAAEGISSPDLVFQRLRETAVDLGSPGRDDTYGWGLVNVADALPYENFIVLPNGGEVLESGSTYTVIWNMPGGAASVDLSYTGGGGNWVSVAEGLTGTRYDWTPLPPDNVDNCVLSAKAYDAGGTLVAIDRSDAPFSIEVVKVTAPSAGEILTSKSYYSITWSVNQTVRPVAKTKIYYSKNGGAKWKSAGSVPGYYFTRLWKVPSTSLAIGNCLVKVVLLDESKRPVGTAISNGYFTISP